MRKLPADKRTQILHSLVEGNSLRATARMADVSFNTTAKLFVDAAKVCADFQDRTLRNLRGRRWQLDEIWSFVFAKEKNVPENMRGRAGDVWTWVAIDADSKLVPSWRIGDRSSQTAMAFIDDLANRLTGRVQITTDGHRAYLEAIEGAFGGDVDYAMLVKMYGDDGVRGPERKYSPMVCTGARKTRIEGNPDPNHVSTSFAERNNLTMRMSIRRFTRLTNAFSKKIENHAHSVALHYMHYNFCRIHKTLRVTPAMAAGVTDRLWTVADIVTLLEAAEPAAAKRGSYKKRAAA